MNRFKQLAVRYAWAMKRGPRKSYCALWSLPHHIQGVRTKWHLTPLQISCLSIILMVSIVLPLSYKLYASTEISKWKYLIWGHYGCECGVSCLTIQLAASEPPEQLRSSCLFYFTVRLTREPDSHWLGGYSCVFNYGNEFANFQASSQSKVSLAI